jgi:hypothetical protein
MSSRRLTVCLPGPVLLLALVSGCQTLHSYRPVPVLVRDAETQQPIPGAEVHITYPFEEALRSPSPSSSATGADGVARLTAAPYGDIDLRVAVNAKGYLTEESGLPVKVVQAIEPLHWFEAAESRPVSLVVQLYAAPDPTVELVIPTGYRGQIKAEVQVQEGLAGAPGQRHFSFEVPTSGVVDLTGPPILRHVCSVAVRARYADGTPLRRDAQGTEVGFWVLNDEGTYLRFLVGTHDEYNAVARSGEDGGKANRSSGGGNANGGGRRGRRGSQSSQPSSDPGP